MKIVHLPLFQRATDNDTNEIFFPRSVEICISLKQCNFHLRMFTTFDCKVSFGYNLKAEPSFTHIGQVLLAFVLALQLVPSPLTKCYSKLIKCNFTRSKQDAIQVPNLLDINVHLNLYNL